MSESPKLQTAAPVGSKQLSASQKIALPLQADEEVVRDWRRPAILGYVLIVSTFVVLGGWSAFAKLDSAVVAPGVVTVEGSRKVVQHLEGGIIAAILVQEGQHVKEGDVLFKLDPTPALANAETARNQLYSNLAQEARLIAERDRAGDITFPADFLQSDRPVVKQAIADQRKQFAERKASMQGQISILKSRIEQYQKEIEGLNQEREATTRQLEWINTELVDLHALLDRNLVQKSRVLAQEREKSRLEGVIGRSIADVSKAENGISEQKLQIDQVLKKFTEDVNTSILDTRQKIADLRERVSVSQDILSRIEIRAPRSGMVQGLKVSTIGGVIRAGEPLLDIIQDDDPFVINAQVSPTDIDVMQPDMLAEVRFSAFHGRILPVIMGKVASVSRDRMTDEQTKQPYFLARVIVSQDSVPADIRSRISAGMPTEVVMPTGERTVLDYLYRPLKNRLVKSFREQ